MNKFIDLRKVLLRTMVIWTLVTPPLSLAAADTIEWKLESAQFLEKNYDSISTNIELQIAMISSEKYRGKILEQINSPQKPCLNEFIVNRAAESKNLEENSYAIDIDELVSRDIRQIDTGAHFKPSSKDVRLVGSSPYTATIYLVSEPVSDSQLAVLKSSFDMMRPLWEAFLPVLQDNILSELKTGSGSSVQLSGGLLGTRGMSCKGNQNDFTFNYPHFFRNYNESGSYTNITEDSLKPLSISQIEFLSEVLEFLDETDSLNMNYDKVFGVVSSVKGTKLEDFGDLSLGGTDSSEPASDEFDDLDLGNIKLK